MQPKFFCITILFMTNMAYATTFPRGCEVSGYSYENGEVIFNESGIQSLYLMQNHSANLIELEYHELRQDYPAPKLKNKLTAESWSFFASDANNQHFRCSTISADDKRTPIDCADILQICQYPRVKFALSNMGTYWVSQNKPQAQVLKDAIAKGILLHW